MQSTKLQTVAYWLVLIGGLNWLFVGLFGMDLVAMIFAPIFVLAKIIYLLIGISACYLIYTRLRFKTP